MKVETSTMNQTIGWIVIATNSAWFCGSPSGIGNSVVANVEMKIAPTPIGPNQPAKQASLNVLTSGIHLYKANIAGKRRQIRMQSAIRTNLQLVRPPNVGSLKESNGAKAPMKIKQAQLNNRSRIEEKCDSSVALLKKPSHANAVPQENAAKRSSEPKINAIPIVNNVRDTY